MADQDHLAERVRTSVGRFVRATRSHADALPPPLAATLGLLDREGDASTASLAQRRGVRHQSQSRTVKDLEALGYIARREDQNGGRRGVDVNLGVDGIHDPDLAHAALEVFFQFIRHLVNRTHPAKNVEI